MLPSNIYVPFLFNDKNRDGARDSDFEAVHFREIAVVGKLHLCPFGGACLANP